VARALLDRHLVACVNIVPGVRSLYRWEGKIEDDGESLLVLKTTRDNVERVIAAVREAHSYDVPEVLSLPVEDGNADYLEWVRDCL